MTSTQRITHCSTVSSEAGTSPVGSAWHLRRIMLVEMPLPWAYNSLRSRHAPEGLEQLVVDVFNSPDVSWGFIGFAPDDVHSVPGMARIFDLSQGDSFATTYHRTSYLVPEDDVVRYLRLLSFAPDDPALDRVREPDDQTTRDFFVCTHGSVDLCCASKGFPIYRLMRHMADGAPHPTRVWRCTHFGGHEFAPTALETPSGRYWARLDARDLGGVMTKSIPPDAIPAIYRGWAALEEPLWQVAESAAFAARGWDWERATITGIRGEASPETGGMLTLAYNDPNEGQGEVDIDIIPTGSVMTISSCAATEPYESPQYVANILAWRNLTPESADVPPHPMEAHIE
ncbi:MAG TPA: sucrase ferredoxin [Thermomicrobiales bacterium]|nr:sucrase ferredoxin [Thermomicrobiales bacterium]